MSRKAGGGRGARHLLSAAHFWCYTRPFFVGLYLRRSTLFRLFPFPSEQWSFSDVPSECAQKEKAGGGPVRRWFNQWHLRTQLFDRPFSIVGQYYLLVSTPIFFPFFDADFSGRRYANLRAHAPRSTKRVLSIHLPVTRFSYCALLFPISRPHFPPAG